MKRHASAQADAQAVGGRNTGEGGSMSELTLMRSRGDRARRRWSRRIVLDSADGAPLPRLRSRRARAGEAARGRRQALFARRPSRSFAGPRPGCSACGSRTRARVARATCTASHRATCVSVSPPRNDFPLHDDARPALFDRGRHRHHADPVHGGCARPAGRDFPPALRRARPRAARLPRAAPGDLRRAARCHYDDDPQTRLNVVSILSDAPPDAVVYVCGPQGMSRGREGRRRRARHSARSRALGAVHEGARRRRGRRAFRGWS